MRVISFEEISCVNGGAGVSNETIGCAAGSVVGSRGGVVGGAVGCVAGAYVANNWSTIKSIVADAFRSLNNVNLTM